MPRVRQVRTMIGTLIIAAGVLAAPASVLAAGCSKAGCNGKDPAAMGCAGNDSKVVARRDINYGSRNLSATIMVSLRYSPACDTKWAKVEITGSNPRNKPFQISLILKDEGYRSIYETSHVRVGGSAYGNMYYAPTTRLRACGALDLFGGGYQCTSAG